MSVGLLQSAAVRGILLRRGAEWSCSSSSSSSAHTRTEDTGLLGPTATTANHLLRCLHRGGTRWSMDQSLTSMRTGEGTRAPARDGDLQFSVFSVY